MLASTLKVARERAPIRVGRKDISEGAVMEEVALVVAGEGPEVAEDLAGAVGREVVALAAHLLGREVMAVKGLLQQARVFGEMQQHPHLSRKMMVRFVIFFSTSRLHNFIIPLFRDIRLRRAYSCPSTSFYSCNSAYAICGYSLAPCAPSTDSYESTTTTYCFHRIRRSKMSVQHASRRTNRCQGGSKQRSSFLDLQQFWAV